MLCNFLCTNDFFFSVILVALSNFNSVHGQTKGKLGIQSDRFGRQKAKSAALLLT